MDKFKHKKKYGQNFLHDDNILNKIANSCSVEEDDLIIEIGPGQGALTRKLQEKNVNLICYEIDEETRPYLEKIKTQKTVIKYQDFLKTDLVKDLKDYKYHNLYVIANLPYYITTPIIQKLIDSKLVIKSMTLMVQKEVADRFSAKVHTKDYNSLTVYLNYYFTISKLFDVSRNCFTPSPNVDSAVVKFSFKENTGQVKNEDIFFKLVKDAFKQKRKTIKNNLKGYDLDKVEKILSKYSLSLQSRAEEISLDAFIDIANELIK